MTLIQNKSFLLSFCKTAIGSFFVFHSSFFVCSPADAAIRVGNQSRTNAAAYQQLNLMQQAAYNQAVAPAGVNVDDLAVRVANTDLAEKIARGDTSIDVNNATLESCAAIYPTGQFAWDVPTAGTKKGGAATCVAVVELRQVKGTQDIVLARANLAAGDAMDCNINNFPESGYTVDAGNFVFPADRAPTVDDVISVMNDEQKKNAGFKIAAGTVLGGVGGNLLTKKDITTGKKDAGTTVVGALTGAAIMAGSSYAGKVGGDMILSSGVNAAAGAAVGNIVGGGESVLRIEDCIVNDSKTTCLWGVIEESKKLNGGTAYYNVGTGATAVCKTNAVESCEKTRLIAIKFANPSDAAKDKSLEEAISEPAFFKNISKRFTLDEQHNKMTPGGEEWIEIKSAGTPGDRTPAMISGISDKTFGLKMKDWYKIRGTITEGQLAARKSDGSSYKLDDKKKWNVNDFYPMTVDATDGGIIDINNKARMSGTLIGAGAGAGLGAFTAYQGATEEIDARWVSSVQEYKDSLQKVYCGTGTRFLSQYNSLTVIPNMQ